MRLIIDSHLDLAWNALAWRRDLTQNAAANNARERDAADDDARGHMTTTLPDMRRGGVAVCLGTVLARCSPPLDVHQYHGALSLDFPTQSIAYAFAQGQLAYYRALASAGQITPIRTAQELDSHWKRWVGRNDGESERLPVGLILAMEGADPILHPDQAEQWFEQGLRCASLVHYGRSAYAVGTGDDGPLLPAGRELLRAFERLGIILDVTHLSDTSFYEAMDRFGGPVLASHQNCRALVPGGRQFSDEQLKLVIDRGGIIGAAMDAWMLYPGWKIGQTSPQVVSLETVADHIDHICQLAGDCEHIAIGSDLDGGFGTEQSPSGLETIADLQKIGSILASRGYDETDIQSVLHGNWLRFFSHHLPGGDPPRPLEPLSRRIHRQDARSVEKTTKF